MTKHRIVTIYISVIVLVIIISVSIIGIIVVGPGIPSEKNVWKIDNRKMLAEYISPDSSIKIGYYNYDEGALGYTCCNLSISPISAEYPIKGNLLMTDTPLSVNWKNKTMVEIHFRSALHDNFPKLKMNSYNGVNITILR
jgi:hypothetical protein